MKIRFMTPEDFDAVYEIWNDFPSLDMETYEVEKYEVLNTIKLNPTCSFVAEEDGEIIGGILGNYDGRRGWINHLGVDQKHQKKGIGKNLFTACEQALIERGARKINVWVKYDNRVVEPFYKKLDYHPKDIAFIMQKNLNKTS